jgi:hypothetical protein
MIKLAGEQTVADVLLAHRRIVVGGTNRADGQPDFFLALLRSNGRPDRGFAPGGALITDLGGSNHAAGLASAPDRRFVLAGERRAPFGEPRPINLVRYER